MDLVPDLCRDFVGCDAVVYSVVYCSVSVAVWQIRLFADPGASSTRKFSKINRSDVLCGRVCRYINLIRYSVICITTSCVMLCHQEYQKVPMKSPDHDLCLD